MWLGKETRTDRLNVTVVRELYPTFFPHPSLYPRACNGEGKGKNNALLSEDTRVFGIQANEGKCHQCLTGVCKSK